MAKIQKIQTEVFYMRINTKEPQHIFTAVVFAALLILTALGNAIALLVFSVVALISWLAVPKLRGQVPFRRSLVAGLVSFAVAVGVAVVLFLSRGH